MKRTLFIGLFAALAAGCQADDLSTADKEFVCKATIAAVMGHSPEIISAESDVKNGIVKTSYVRQSDGTTWKNLCEIEGKKVYWATLADDGTAGRWRNSAFDSVITFSLKDQSVEISEKFGDGSVSNFSFVRTGQ